MLLVSIRMILTFMQENMDSIMRDVVHYSSSGTPLSGMSTTSDYYISVIMQPI